MRSVIPTTPRRGRHRRGARPYMPRVPAQRSGAASPRDYETLCDVAARHRDGWSIQYRDGADEPYVASPHDTRLTPVSSRSLAVLDLMLTACPVPVTPIVHRGATPAEHTMNRSILPRVLKGLRDLPVEVAA